MSSLIKVIIALRLFLRSNQRDDDLMMHLNVLSNNYKFIRNR